MMNMIVIEGIKAIIQYDPDIDMFRGEFIGLNGSADFYAADIGTLKEEGKTSLKVFLDMCKEDGVESYKQFSGKFNVRIDPSIHEQIVVASKAQMMSLNEFVSDAIASKLNEAS